MLGPDDLVTLESADGFSVVQRLGTVRGSASRPRNMLRATFRSIGAFIGLAAVEYLTDAERAREEALAELRAHAEEIGADAVIGIRFEAVECDDGSTRVLAYGNAVRLKRAGRAA